MSVVLKFCRTWSKYSKNQAEPSHCALVFQIDCRGRCGLNALLQLCFKTTDRCANLLQQKLQKSAHLQALQARFEIALLPCEQGSPVLHGFCHMRDLHASGSRQIGNRAGHFKAAVNAAA